MLVKKPSGGEAVLWHRWLGSLVLSKADDDPPPFLFGRIIHSGVDPEP